MAMARRVWARALVEALRVARPLDLHPALTVALGVLHRARGARKPAARGRRAAGEQVLMGHPHAHPGGLVAPSGPDVFLERAPTGGDPLLDAPEEEEREPDAVEGFGCLLFFEGGREDVACGSPLRPLEEAQPLRALIYGHPASLAGQQAVAAVHPPVWSPHGQPW